MAANDSLACMLKRHAHRTSVPDIRLPDIQFPNIPFYVFAGLDGGTQARHVP